jgi:hypothetical protein
VRELTVAVVWRDRLIFSSAEEDLSRLPHRTKRTKTTIDDTQTVADDDASVATVVDAADDANEKDRQQNLIAALRSEIDALTKRSQDTWVVINTLLNRIADLEKRIVVLEQPRGQSVLCEACFSVQLKI